MKNRTLTKTSIFHANEGTVFAMLRDIKTLQTVAYPLATFSALDKNKALVWNEGSVFQFKFKLFDTIPFGIHTINVVEFNEKSYRIYTNESNTHVPIWNHRIILSPIDESRVKYTDEVEINAGWKTPFVYLWAKCFYSHRQRKWIELLRDKK